ncbi:MAG: DnaD domain protein [Clostridia bacterium]|nr:DnaD domain protein [Clostridia bacterium]
MKLNFQQDVLVLPGSLLTHCSEADAATLRVLLWLATDLSLAEKPKQLSKLADCDVRAVKAALRFWEFRDVLVKESEESVPAMATVSATEEKTEKPKAAATEKEKRPLLRRADELPNYTTVELAELMEQRAAVRILVDEAQRILGKMFNPSEVNILVGMMDYLGMNEECILLLLAHCKRIGKVNLRSIEKYAFSLADKGITEAEAMEQQIRTVEAMHTFEGEVRTLFGMKSRALTSKESKMLTAWVSFGYGIDIVRLAYEMTVSATNEPSVPYANAILERWNAEGLRTLEQIEKHLAEEKEKREGKKNGGAELGNSFNADDFLEAALRRGLGDWNAEN